MKLKTLSNIVAIVSFIVLAILFIFNAVRGFYWDLEAYIVWGLCLVLAILILKIKTPEYWDD